jgi:hydrogenase nickel incorporation protein HypA/HybF
VNVHEYSIVQALMEQVEAEAFSHHASRVGRVHVRLGELSGVDPELLKLAFETFRERTICEGAELALRLVPASWVCRSCGQPLPKDAVLRCEECGQPGKLSQGDEIILDRLEMEVFDV